MKLNQDRYLSGGRRGLSIKFFFTHRLIEIVKNFIEFSENAYIITHRYMKETSDLCPPEDMADSLPSAK